MFTIRAYLLEDELEDYTDYPKEFDNQTDAEIKADKVWRADSEHEDGPRFDAVVVLNDDGKEVYTKEE